MLLKGALVGVDPFNPLASVAVFQYYPETLTRTLTARAAGAQATRSEALRLAGPPEETIRLEVEIDASDQLETADPIATSMGLHPTLAALEMLLYPKSALVIANEALARVGIIEMIPAEALWAVMVAALLPHRAGHHLAGCLSVRRAVLAHGEVRKVRRDKEHAASKATQTRSPDASVKQNASTSDALRRGATGQQAGPEVGDRPNANTAQIVVREATGKGCSFDDLVQGVRKGYKHHQVVREKTPNG